MNAWQRTLMNQVGSAGLGVGGSGGVQMQDVVGLAAAADPEFVMLRDNTREKIHQFLERGPLLAVWRRRLRALSRRLEEILFRKYPNKMEYYNMSRQPMPPALMFAMKTFRAQIRQYLQNQQSLRQIVSSSGYGAMNLTSNIVQGASENSRMSSVTGDFGASSSSANMVLQNVNMDTSLPAGAPDDGHVNTVLSLGINPTRHDLSRASNNNQARPTPMKDLPRVPKFNCPVCISEMVDASSTICGHIFCKKCIEASIRFQKKCPTCRRRLTMRNFHRIYLPAMD
ncbi:probable histone acetyltransferase HAC-like 1 [Hordeum vulgare subsp. vulgare]|uniref:probable histone acetyltransferase HAC-like 1 n=1 Tax=Hordeum vulgare subsp. vulgare TaxID=112509 RepID=UPI001D1A37F0|nr:probable histone acetyltransferase HAC-like 1 [Hordeum vulgare subsp. vulgare]